MSSVTSCPEPGSSVYILRRPYVNPGPWESRAKRTGLQDTHCPIPNPSPHLTNNACPREFKATQLLSGRAEIQDPKAHILYFTPKANHVYGWHKNERIWYTWENIRPVPPVPSSTSHHFSFICINKISLDYWEMSSHSTMTITGQKVWFLKESSAHAPSLLPYLFLSILTVLTSNCLLERK